MAGEMKYSPTFQYVNATLKILLKFNFKKGWMADCQRAADVIWLTIMAVPCYRN
jgi:hypothetical protein